DQAEAANRAKDHFLAVLSHELRTPLTPALATLAMMQQESDLTGDTRQALQVVQRNVELEAQLIDDLLDTTRIARGKLELHPQIVDAHEKIRAAADIFRGEIEAKSLRLVVDLSARQHHVQADPVRLQQVFWNLISNSVKYTPRQGSITIRSSNAPDGILKVQVTDTGIGIEPEIMQRLFTAFEQGEQTLTRRFGGLGLGLSITKALVETHGGKLTATSQGKDKGATFTVQFKVVVRPPAGPVSPQPPLRQDRPVRILLVDDNLDTLHVMTRLLRTFGHEVRTAASIQEALEAAKGQFDLIISDIGLPDGTGWDLMRTLQKRHPVRGIALSGFASDEDARKSMGAGFVAHLAKPINPQQLETAIQQAAAGVQ
ncbi:MAG: ATP-binding protein, partial [Bacillota bacterium]